MITLKQKVQLIGNVVGGISGLSMTTRHFAYKLHEKLLIGWYVEFQMEQLKVKYRCQ